MEIKFKNITKSFGNILANKDINFTISSGKIHALLGGNGAGKSTLVKILSGHYRADDGEIMVGEEKLELGSTKDSIKNGIGILAQDPLDFSNLNVLESFIVGSKNSNPFINIKGIKKNILEQFKKYKINVNPEDQIRDLSVGERQQVELIRLLFNGTKVIILDEPTNGFSLEQKQLVFEVLKSLNKVGFIIILVSHKLDEVLDLCQEATILKRGEIVSTVQLPCPSDQIINLMFDSKFSAKTNNEKENSKKSELGSILINFSKKPKSIQYYDQDINFPCGKTTGVIGLQGSGADQFIRECFSGKINITIKNENSDNFIPEKYFYYTPSDRLEKGLFNELKIYEHVAISRFSDSQIIDWKKVENKSIKLIDDFNIKGEKNTLASELSGGNQQKLMLALIPEEIGLLLMEQPTRGLDVQSASFIWRKIKTRSNSDYGSIFSTTDIEEVWSYSDYIMCFSGNSITHFSDKSNISKDEIPYLISGVSSNGK